jgi:uncharacterized membrane protein YqgA involved in biofilm formation
VILPVGTLINMITVTAGTLVGVLIGDRLPERMRETAMAAIGLVTLVLGVRMAGATHNILVTLVSVLIGGIIGEWWHIDEALDRLGRRVEVLIAGKRPAEQVPTDGAPRSSGVATAFVTASLIFCVGPITVIGSIQDGLTGDYQLLAIKSLLDMIASLTLASTLGWGVGLAVFTILVVQGGISLLAGLLGRNAVDLVNEHTLQIGTTALPLGSAMLDEMTAAGGVLMLGIGLLLLDLKHIRVANLLPALVLAPASVVLLYSTGIPIAPP